MSKRRMLLMSIALLVVAVFGIEAVSRLVFAPWAIGYFGRDTLTGGWVGTTQARQGAEYGLYLNLKFERGEGGFRNNAGSSRTTNLRGHATLCTSGGERYDYDVQGSANRSGEVEALWLEYGDPSLSGLNLRMSGAWNAPTLSLTSDANPFMPDGQFVRARVVSSADPDDSLAPFTLTKDDMAALEAICEQIQMSSP